MSVSLRLPSIGPFVTPFDGREIVYWEDERSLTWLSRTMANKPFAKIVRFYEAQADKFMCGPATVAIVLNALKMDSPNQLPLDSEHERFAQQMNSTLPQDYCASFARYTQKNIFDNHSRVKTLAEVYGNLCSNKLFSPGLNPVSYTHLTLPTNREV